MATPATVNPFNFYPGRDGLPLQNGYLYFGEPFQDPELQPLQAYWDDANTQPAARPIRTINGYPARNGTPAQVFVAAQYSMRVRDSQGREVFYAPNVTAVDLGGGGLDIITASGGQTVVNLTNAAYTPGSNAIDVSLNGLILISGQDYFETGTTRITMASALSAGDQIRAFARSTFGLTQAVLSDWQAEVFDGDGTASQNFTLTRSPGAVANLDISVAGETLRPLLDYTLSGQVVTITPAPAAGTDNVLIRYGRSLPQDALRGELSDTSNVANGGGLSGTKYYTALGAAALNLNSYIEDDGAYNVMGFIPQNLKAAIRNHTSTTDVHSYLTLANTAALADEMRGVYYPRGQFCIGSELLVTLSGNRTNQAFRMSGVGVNGARIKRLGSLTSMLRFYGGGGPSEALLLLENFSLIANEVGDTLAFDCNGLTLEDIAQWNVNQVRTQYCKDNLVLDGSLIGRIQDCGLSDGRRGIVTKKTGAYAACNTITVAGRTLLNNNRECAAQIGEASQFTFDVGVNIERNGVAVATVTISNASPGVVTYTATELLADMAVVFTTTGSLPTGLTAGTTYYVKSLLSADTFTVSATVGGAAINTSSAGSGTHTCTPQTHGVIIKDTCVDTDGTAMVSLDGLWMEANKGGYAVYQEAMDGVGEQFQLSIRRSNILQANGIKTLGSRHLTISECKTATNTVFDLDAEFATVQDTTCGSVIDTNVTYPTYINFRTGTADYASGKTETYTASLTGCTTVPTGNVRWRKQGKSVRLYVPVITGTSNTTAATLTGMPAELWPSVAVQDFAATVDNGTEKFSPITIGTNGVITLNNAFSGTFTNSGTKGTSSGWTLNYDI